MGEAPGLLIAVCQRPLQESISHKLLERRKKFQGKITPNLRGFYFKQPLLEFRTSARYRCRIIWTSGNLFWFMLFIGNALIHTHDSFSFHLTGISHQHMAGPMPGGAGSAH